MDKKYGRHDIRVFRSRILVYFWGTNKPSAGDYVVYKACLEDLDSTWEK